MNAPIPSFHQDASTVEVQGAWAGPAAEKAEALLFSSALRSSLVYGMLGRLGPGYLGAQVDPIFSVFSRLRFMPYGEASAWTGLPDTKE